MTGHSDTDIHDHCILLMGM